jgi:hypothetical protein
LKQVVIVAAARNPLNVWTEAKARKATLDRVQKAANLFAEIALIWGDVDESAVSIAEEHGRQMEEFGRYLQDCWAEQEGDAA